LIVKAKRHWNVVQADFRACRASIEEAGRARVTYDKANAELLDECGGDRSLRLEVLKRSH